MTRAISWAAVSSKPQAEKESLNDQHRLNHALAEALDWELVADITVPGESRSYHRMADAVKNLAAYRTLQEHATSGNIQWIIVKSRDRLARTRRLNRAVADYLQDHGVRVYSRTMPPSNTDERTEADVWGEAIESGYSEAEVLRLKQRREMGMKARVRRGSPPSRLPFGFAYVSDGSGKPRVQFVDPEAERTVRFVIDSFLRGVTKKWIIEEANSLGLATSRGGKWGKDLINRILNQPAYYGMVAYGRRRYIRRNGKRTAVVFPWEDCILAEATFEGLYDPSLWDRVQAEQRRRDGDHPRSRNAPFLLSQLLYCVHHDRFFTGNQREWGGRYYRCRSVTRDWRIHSMRTHVIHQKVVDYFIRLARNPRILDELLGQMEAPDDQGWEMEERRLLADRDDTQLRQRRVWEAYESGVITLPDFTERARALKARLDKNTQELARIDAERQRVRERDELRDLLIHELPQHISLLANDNLTPQERQALRANLTSVLRAILIEDDEVTGLWLAGAM